MKFMRRISSFLKPSGQNGVAAVELAIVLPLLILLFTGMIEYGRLMWHYDALAKATRDAARYLAEEAEINDSGVVGGKQDKAKDLVLNTATAAGIEGLVKNNVTITCAGGCGTPTTVRVDVAYGFTIGGWVPVVGPAGSSITTVTLSPHTTMRYML